MAQEIYIEYSINTSDIDKARAAFDKLTAEEQAALNKLKAFNDELEDTGASDSFASVQKRAASLRAELSKLSPATDQFKNKAKELKSLESTLGGIEKKMAGVTEKTKGASGGIGGLIGKLGPLGPAIAGAFSIGAVVAFGKETLETAGRFEKLGAVLKNTLGSGSAAEGAMLRIQEIAATTPFSVEELTASFVKLANQGFKPTNSEIIALGDLAASTGKSFDMLAEALIDAQVGEFERLKEFGVRASKAGDQVTFTFKGQQTVIQNTSAEIQKYIVSLGQVEGVAGAMKSISETTEGAVSNLGDAWDGFLASIGNNLAPLFKKTLKFTAEFLTDLKNLFQTEDGKIAENRGKAYNKYNEQLQKNSLQAVKNAEENSFTQLKIEEKKLKELEKKNAKSYSDINDAAMLAGNQAGLLKSKRDDTFIQGEVTKQKQKIAYLTALNQAAHDVAIDKIDKEKAAQADRDKKDKAAAEQRVKNAKEAKAQTEKDYQAAVKQVEIEKQITQEKIKQTVPEKDQPIAMKEAEMAANIQLYEVAKQYGDKGVQDAKDRAKVLPEILKTQNKEITDNYKEAYDKESADYVKALIDKVQATRSANEKIYQENLAQIDKDEKLAATQIEASGLKGEALQKAQIENQITFNNKRIEENTRAAEAGVLAAQDANEQLLADNAKLNAELLAQDQDRAKNRMDIFNASLDAAKQISDGFFQIYQQQLANEQSALQAKYNEEIRLADGNKQKINEIEEKRAAKEKEIKKKQFEAQRAQAIANVVFNTAPIIAQYLAGVLTAPLAAIAVGAQLAQIGFILAQPVPEFAEGTKGKKFKGGKAIVGERGTEKVITESGKVYYTPPTATLLDLPSGSQVVPNHLLSRQEIAFATISKGSQRARSENIGGQLSEIGAILKGLPIHQINMDERGFEKFIRTERRSTKILNNKFPQSFS